jgi:hypothetical protein
VDVYLRDISFHYETLAYIINWALITNIETITGEEVPPDYRVHMSIQAIATISSYERGSDDKRLTGKEHRMHEQHHVWAFGNDLWNSREVSWDEIYNWMMKNDNHFQKICSGSDAFADIEKIYELIVTFKLVPISGQGFVILK